MAIVVHTIDTNADTVIVLKNPLVEFAIWNPPGDVPVKGMPPPEDSPIEEPISTWDYDEETAAAEEAVAEEPVVEPAMPEDSSFEDIHYRVSLNHLRLGSSYFGCLFSGDWKQTIRVGEDGCYYTTLHDQDPEALLIFLNVLHLRNRQVPRSVSLETLAKIALLVNFCDSAEAFELSAEMWIKNLKSTQHIPSEPCEDLMLWMFIAWVFRLPDEFAQTTSVAIKSSKQGDLKFSDLPIREIFDEIDKLRNQAMSVIVANMTDLLETYRSTDYKCPYSDSYGDSYNNRSFECGSMLYGALTKGLDSLRLSAPYIATSFPDTSVQELYTKLCNIRSPTWYSSGGRHPSHHSCRLSDKIKPVVDEVMGSILITGLNLEHF